MDIIQNKIKQYSGMKYKTGPVSVSDIISDKPNKLHAELYNNAIENLLTDLCEQEIYNNSKTSTFKFGQIFKQKFINKTEYITEWKSKYKKSHKFIEIKNDDYLLPSSVMILSTSYPYTKTTQSLSPYWNYTEYFKTYNIEDIKLSDDIAKYSEIIYTNYATGKCKLRSKFGDEFWVPFKSVNGFTKVNNDATLEGTFGYLLNK